jgi:hypothetical protein
VGAMNRARDALVVGSASREATPYFDEPGLLTSASSYWPRLPTLAGSGWLRCSSAVTVAGQRRICTGFPFVRLTYLAVKCVRCCSPRIWLGRLVYSSVSVKVIVSRFVVATGAPSSRRGE